MEVTFFKTAQSPESEEERRGKEKGGMLQEEEKSEVSLYNVFVHVHVYIQYKSGTTAILQNSKLLCCHVDIQSYCHT